jgi:hypothetical protein
LRIKRTTIIAAVIASLIIIFSIRPLLSNYFHISWPDQLMLLSLILLALSYLIGYPFCHAYLGPRILEENGKRKLEENYTYFGNILQMENDLKELAKQNNNDAIQVLKIINLCKWSFIVNLILLVVSVYIGVNMKS